MSENEGCAYLGVTLSNDGGSKENIDIGIVAVTAVLARLSKVWSSLVMRRINKWRLSQYFPKDKSRRRMKRVLTRAITSNSFCLHLRFNDNPNPSLLADVARKLMSGLRKNKKSRVKV